jgi:hypothetical protein
MTGAVIGGADSNAAPDCRSAHHVLDTPTNIRTIAIVDRCITYLPPKTLIVD